MPSYTAPPIPTERLRGAGQVELVFHGVEQAGPSFEARVFLNNPAADANTPRTPEMGYAGSFHVYGYGDPAPPKIRDASRERSAGGPPVAPIEKRLRVDEAALRLALERADEISISVVPVASDSDTPIERAFERVEVVLDRVTS